MIYVVAHKMYTSPKLDDSYKTIYVGDKIREEARNKGYIIDSDDDSISQKNPNYCELTALYWIWKNDKTDEWTGLNHYRRYFLSPDTGKILNKYDIKQILSQYDVILWNKIILNESVERFYYRGAGYKKDITLLKQVIKSLYPEYLNDCEDVLRANSASYANMFVMHREAFDAYCSWLFDILFAMEKKLDMSGYTAQEKRVFGYLGEILLNVWIKKNGLSIKYCEVINTENNEISTKSKAKMALKQLVKRIVYFPTGIKYKRLLRK